MPGGTWNAPRDLRCDHHRSAPAGRGRRIEPALFRRVLRHRARPPRPGGILQQWLPGGDATSQSAFARSVRRSFRDVRVLGVDRRLGVSFPGQRAADAAVFRRRTGSPPARRGDAGSVEWGPEATAEQQFAKVLQREVRIEELIAGDPKAPPLTDDRPVNEYYLLAGSPGTDEPLRPSGLDAAAEAADIFDGRRLTCPRAAASLRRRMKNGSGRPSWRYNQSCRDRMEILVQFRGGGTISGGALSGRSKCRGDDGRLVRLQAARREDRIAAPQPDPIA